MVAALPIVGGYSEYIFLSSDELVPVPPGLDHAGCKFSVELSLLTRCSTVVPA
jgi:NADPH:quinone reductase-like Zn-dependent oxidoreductase